MNSYLNDRIADKVCSSLVRSRCLRTDVEYMFFSHVIQVPHTLLQRGWGATDITAESTPRIAYKSSRMLIKWWNRSHVFWSVRSSTGAFS